MVDDNELIILINYAMVDDNELIMPWLTIMN